MTQIYTLKNKGLENRDNIGKTVASYGIYECLDLTREISYLEEAELKDEVTRFIIANLETRLKSLIFG